MELNGDQFRYESRIKNKPNAQGTLFQVNPSQRTPESRQPRGYSPQRYGEVADALDIKRKNFGPGTYGGHEHGGMAMQVYRGHAETLARATSAVARSTVPMSDITRPDASQPSSQENPSLHMGVWNRTSEEAGELGHYSAPGTTAQPDEGHIALSIDATDNTPIHEIGHHVDRDSDRGRSPEAHGHAEGFADSYAQEHGRTAGYKQKPVPVESRPSAWNNSYGMKDDNYSHARFAGAYTQERSNLNTDQFSFESRRASGELPKEHVTGQLPLLHKQPAGRRMNRQTRDYEDAPASWSYNHELMDRGE